MNDQYIIPLFVAGSLLLMLFGFFLIVYLTAQKKRQNQHLLERKQMIFDHENNILRTKIEEQENTMDEISKELHDNVKSVLGFAQFNMHRLADLATTEEQSSVVERTNSILGTVMDDLHRITHSLNSNFVKIIGLVDTITKELEHIKLAKNIACNIEIIGEPISLPEDTELHIFRIAQEAIQNCAKHSQATNLNFILTYEPTSFSMKITDNGKGFDMNKIHEMKGLGFINMFQRARFIHASLEVQSTPLHGSTILLTLNTDSHE